MKSRDVILKNVPGVGCGGSCRDGVGHVRVGWVMQRWGGSCRGGVGHVGVGMSYRGGLGWGMSCRGGVGHVRVGWGCVM